MFFRHRSSAAYLFGILPVLLILFAFSNAVYAQEQITYDEVNAVASRMYCPECENIPLDKCFTEVCVQWKQDIAQQLEEGRSSELIINDFVARFGDQVVGVPQDATLRTLTLLAPWLLAVGIAAFGLYTYMRLRTDSASREAAAMASSDATLDAYRQRIERDLSE